MSESVVEDGQTAKLSYDFRSRVAVVGEKKLGAEGRNLLSGFRKNTQKKRNPMLMRGEDYFHRTSVVP